MMPSSTPPISAQAAREVRRDTAIRRARTCYDHLAGVAGVELFDEIFKRGWLEETETVLARCVGHGRLLASIAAERHGNPRQRTAVGIDDAAVDRSHQRPIGRERSDQKCQQSKRHYQSVHYFLLGYVSKSSTVLALRASRCAI